MLGVENGSRHETGANAPPISGENVATGDGAERPGAFRLVGQLSRDTSVPTILPVNNPEIGEQVGQHVSRVAMM